MKIVIDDIAFEESGDDTLLIAGAGTQWEKVVDVASDKALFGIENLAGIPGTVGGATAQNIGAYGSELSMTFEYADVIDVETSERKRVTKKEAVFAYRTSFFKKHRELVVVRVALRLSKNGAPNLNYPDIAKVVAAGTPLVTPSDIVRVIRAIRAKKFPNSSEEGTAGSFFKNPVISRELADSLLEHFHGLPVFPQDENTVKVSLAWILDHALSLKGFSVGNVRLYEQQTLVIVACAGATAKEVDAFANVVAELVFKETGIVIEREVEMFGVQK
jgi:UDP-N-acetylmuramate dehydrogenase